MKIKTINDEIIIPLDKIKILYIFLGSLVFVLFGIMVLNDPEEFGRNRFRGGSPEFNIILGILSVTLFGIGGIFIFKKLFDKKAGIIISKSGITDNSSSITVGLVKWNDIIEIEKNQSANIIVIKVSNPEYYIAVKKSRIGKMAMKKNYKRYGSPIYITPVTLKINFEELSEIIEKTYKKNAPRISKKTVKKFES
uniref:STM3941 family protein n=1 Tax=Flavobacterium sp. TaxID=239 RepID=UPI004049945C